MKDCKHFSDRLMKQAIVRNILLKIVYTMIKMGKRWNEHYLEEMTIKVARRWCVERGKEMILCHFRWGNLRGTEERYYDEG